MLRARRHRRVGELRAVDHAREADDALQLRRPGRVLAFGEEFPDLWRIDVVANRVSTYRYEADGEELTDDKIPF